MRGDDNIRRMSIMDQRDVIFEFTVIGNVVRVNAMDTATLTEITIQGPVGVSDQILQKNALKRLEYVLRKKGIIG